MNGEDYAPAGAGNQTGSLHNCLLVDPTGIVVTDIHVVAGAKKVEVVLASGESYVVSGIREVDRDRDLALLQIAGFNLSTARLGDSNNVRLGEAVVV